MTRWPQVREAILLVAGLVGIINEAVFQDQVDPVLVALYAGMMGLAPFLRKDEGDKP